MQNDVAVIFKSEFIQTKHILIMNLLPKNRTIKAHFDFLDAVIDVEVEVFGYNIGEWKLISVSLAGEDYTHFIYLNELVEQVLDLLPVDKAIREMQQEFFDKMLQDFRDAKNRARTGYTQLNAA